MRRRVGLLALAGALVLLPAPPADAVAPALSGVVTLGGKAVAAVPIAWYEPGAGTVHATRTDASGRFRLPAPATGVRYLVAANVAGLRTVPRAADDRYLTAFVGAGSGADDVPAAPLVAPATADGRDRTLRIDVARSTVLRSRTAAFADQGVELRTLADEVADTTTADATGAWSFRVAPGGYRIAVREHAGWLAYRSSVVRAGSRMVVQHARPSPTATLSGVVRTSTGRPLARAFVGISGPQGIAYPEHPEVRTDALGRYAITGLAPARYRVRFSGPPDGSFVMQQRTLTVQTGQRVRSDARLAPGARLSVILKAATDGTPWTDAFLQDARGAVVAVRQSSAERAVAASPISFTGLPGGTYRLVVAAGDRMLDRRVRIAPRATVRLGALRPAEPALVLDGRAPAGADVSVEQGTLTVSAKAGTDGAFQLHGLVPGTYTVGTLAPGRLRSVATVVLPSRTPVVLSAGAAEPTEFHQVHATITAAGSPVPQGQLLLTDGSFVGIADGRTGDGTTATNVLPPGSYVVRSVATRFAARSLLPRATPYWLAWTGPRIVVRSGADPDLGTVDLAVRGGP